LLGDEVRRDACVEAAALDDELKLLAGQALSRALDARSGEVRNGDLVASHREGDGVGGGNDGGREEPGGEGRDLENAHQDGARALSPGSGDLASRPLSRARRRRVGLRPSFEEPLAGLALGAHASILSRVRTSAKPPKECKKRGLGDKRR
jgi:hypothetical protein